MNYDITFCANKSCKRKKECKRHIDNYIFQDNQYVSMCDFSCKETNKKLDYFLKR